MLINVSIVAGENSADKILNSRMTQIAYRRRFPFITTLNDGLLRQASRQIIQVLDGKLASFAPG